MKPVSEMTPGESMRLERISEELELDAEMMRFLDVSGLRPDATVELMKREPQGETTVRVNGRPIGLADFAADRLFVSELVPS